MKTLKHTLCVFVAGALISGCASKSYEKASTTSSSLERAAQSIDKGIAQIDTVLLTLTNLVTNPGANLESHYKQFVASVDALESVSKDVAAKARDMQASGAEYFQRWDEDLAKIQNEDIRSRSTERRKAVSARFDSVKTNYQQASNAFTPFMSNLKDIRTALGADLTAGGIDAIQDVVKKAYADAVPLREALQKLSTDFRELGVSLATSTLPPK
jgi:hypothetical protein